MHLKSSLAQPTACLAIFVAGLGRVLGFADFDQPILPDEVFVFQHRQIAVELLLYWLGHFVSATSKLYAIWDSRRQLLCGWRDFDSEKIVFCDRGARRGRRQL